MKLEQYLKHKFEYEEKQTNKSVSNMQSKLLSHLELQKKRATPRYQQFFLTAFAVVLLVVAGSMLTRHSSLRNVLTVQQVSAQEVINKTSEFLKNTDLIHYKIYYGGKQYTKPQTPEESAKYGIQETKPKNATYEFWYDFKKGITRVEIPEFSPIGSLTVGNGKSVLIEKKIDEKDSSILYTYKADANIKEGLFQDFHSIRGYAFRTENYNLLPGGINSPEDPHKKFEDILAIFNKSKGTTLETITENGKEYYKLNLEFPFDQSKAIMQLTGYTLIIEKETYRPYKETLSYDNGFGTNELTYQEVDSDFEESIFGPVPPKGYTIAEKPRVKFADRFATAGPVFLSACWRDPAIDPKEEVNHTGCADGVYGTYSPDIDLFTDKGTVLSPGNMPVVGLNFKLYKSKQTYATKEEAKSASPVDYLELKSAEGELVFPETEKPLPNTFRRFKLEMWDSKTNTKLQEIESVQEVIITEVRG